MGFQGFPVEGLQFLKDLGSNNNKEWFDAHKKTFVRTLQEPAQMFVEELGQRLQTISDGIRYDTRTNGSGSLMRINRDVRFSEDKTPYKTNISMMFWEGPGKKTEHPAFGFQFQANEGGSMAGIFGFPKPMLEVYRQAVLDDELGEALLEAVQQIESAGEGYVVHGQHFKRVPRGYPADHPRAEWLKFAGLYTHAPQITVEQLTAPNLVDVCYELCVKMAPIQRWLVRVFEHGSIQ